MPEPAGGLALTDLTLTRRGLTLVRGLSLTVHPGSTLAVTGPSGAGKTTLLRTVAGLSAPDSGGVTRPSGRLAQVFQEPRLMPWYSAHRNVAHVVEVTVENWASVDVLTSLLVNAGTDVAAVPTYVPANLASKGVDVRLLAVQVWGMLYVIGPEGSASQGIEALRGQQVAVPMPNNMPDLVFRYLLGELGWDTGSDLTVQPYAEGQEAVSALLTGSATYAVLPEHVATVALAKAAAQGLALERTVDLQQLWSEVTGGPARFPMAGLAVPSAIAGDDDAVAALLTELEACVADTNEAGESTVSAIAERTGVDAAVVTQLIPRLQLDLQPAAAVRTELEDFYTRLATLSPDIIGGVLPGDEFYVADPR